MNDRLSPQVRDSVEDTPAISLVRMILAARLIPSEKIERLLGNPVYAQYVSAIVGGAVENIMKFSDIIEGQRPHIESSDITVESTPITIGLDEESGEMLRVHINEVFKGALHHVYQAKDIVGAWGDGLGAFGTWNYAINTAGVKPVITLNFSDEQKELIYSERINWAYLVSSNAIGYFETNHGWKTNCSDDSTHGDPFKYSLDWKDETLGTEHQIDIIMPFDMTVIAEFNRKNGSSIGLGTKTSDLPASSGIAAREESGTADAPVASPASEHGAANGLPSGTSNTIKFKAPEGLGEFLLTRLGGTMDTQWQIRLIPAIRAWNNEHPDKTIHNYYDTIAENDKVSGGKLWREVYGVTNRESACAVFGLPAGTFGVTKKSGPAKKDAPALPEKSNPFKDRDGEPELVIPKLGMRGPGYGAKLPQHGETQPHPSSATPVQPALVNKNTSKLAESPHHPDPGKAEKIQQLKTILERINGGFQAALKHLSKSGKQFSPWSGIGEIGTFSWERIQEPGKPLTVSILFTDAQKGWRNGEVDIWGHLVTKAAKTYLESNYKFGWDNQLYAYKFTNEAGIRVYIRMPYTVDVISSKRQQDVPDITLSTEGNIDANATMKGFQDIFSSYLQGIYSEVQVHESQGKGGIKINGTSIPVVKDSFKMDLEHGYMVTKKESNKTITIYPGNVVQSILDFMKREALIKSFLIQSMYEETGGGFRGENDESITILNNGGAPIITFEWYGWTINFHTKKNDGIEA